MSMRDNIAYEAALGDRGPVGRAVRHLAGGLYSPTAEDGYPQPIFDKRTGRDRPSQLPSTGREHYDLDAILQRDWTTLGPKLQGKIHLYVARTTLTS